MNDSNKNSKALIGIFLMLTLMFSFSILPLVAVVNAAPSMQIQIVYVKFNSGGGSMSHTGIRNTYEQSYYYAIDWWESGARDVDGNPWRDAVPPYRYVTFQNPDEFRTYWENQEPATRGEIYVLDTERHDEYWWGVQTYWSAGRNNIPNGKFSAYLYARYYDPSTHTVGYISSYWMLQVYKQALGWSLTMGDCWYGNFPGVNCLMEISGFYPEYCTDLCWLCYRSLDGIKSQYGW